MAAGAVGVLFGRRSAATPNPATHSATQPAVRSAYEYRVMSLMEMFGDTDAGAKRVGELMVESPGPVHRTDMNSADYQEALDRLADEGWEVVTVNKSNYWVFRRLKNSTGG